MPLHFDPNVAGLVLTIIAAGFRLESRLTRLETLFKSSDDNTNKRIDDAIARIVRLEDK